MQEESKVDYVILDKLKNYRKRTKLSKEISKLLVNQLSSQEIKKAKEEFQKMDIHNNGIIEFGELKKVLVEHGSFTSDSEINEIISRVSGSSALDDKTHIKYSDFIRVTLDLKRYLTKEKLYNMY